MNRPFKPIPAAGSSPFDGSNLAGVSMPPRGTPATFSCRTEDCPVCDRATQFTCDVCWNSGEVDAACADCARVVPINDDGLCEPCAMMSELSTEEWNARFLSGWLRAETSALMMGRK